MKSIGEKNQVELIQLSFTQQKQNFLMNLSKNKKWSLFLPNHRENSIKRIPFDLAYNIVYTILEEN